MFLSFFWNISYLILIYLYACIFLVFFFWPFLCLVRFLCCLFFMSVNILKEYQYNAHTHTHQHMCVVFSFCFPSVMSICATNILNARPDSIYVPLIFWKRKKGKTYTKNCFRKTKKKRKKRRKKREKEEWARYPIWIINSRRVAETGHLSANLRQSNRRKLPQLASAGDADGPADWAAAGRMISVQWSGSRSSGRNDLIRCGLLKGANQHGAMTYLTI